MTCTRSMQAVVTSFFVLLASSCALTEELAPETTVAATESPSSPAVDDADQVVCRKYDSTGSRVRREKVCMTNREWARISEDAQSYTSTLQSGGSTQAGGENLQRNPDGSGGR